MPKHHLKNLLRPQMKTNILDKIHNYKINEVKERKINFPQNDIIDLIKDDKKTLGFRDKLIEKNDKGLGSAYCVAFGSVALHQQPSFLRIKFCHAILFHPINLGKSTQCNCCF